jgi:biotin operon repressor
MRKYLFFLILLAITPVFASLPSKYEKYEVNIYLNENRIAEETINLTFPERVDIFNFYLLHQPRNLVVLAGDKEISCDWRYEGAGTLISCRNFNSSNIIIKYKIFGLVTIYNNYYVFSDRYIITTSTDNFKLKVFLPKGYILVESEEIEPFLPPGGVQKTDGRLIYVEWNMKPKVGEVYDISVFYEKSLRTDQFLVFIFTGIILLGLILVFIYFRRQPKIVDIGLTEDEKKVLNIVAHESKVSQKKIARETGLSKAQVSRIAKSLEARGLIERKRKGRSYEIVLK